MQAPYIFEVIARMAVLAWDWFTVHYYTIAYILLGLFFASFVVYIITNVEVKVVNSDNQVQVQPK